MKICPGGSRQAGHAGGKRENMPRHRKKKTNKEKRNIMYIKRDEIKREKEQILKELEKLEWMEKKFPQGELLCTKNNNRYKWLLKEQNGTSYLPKSKRQVAETLAMKKYYECKKKELTEHLSACEAFLKKMNSEESKSEQLLYHPEYSKLLEKHFLPVNEQLKDWQSADYEKCKKYEENLKIEGTQGKMLRSKSEAIIDMMLYKNRIPFRYEEKLVLDGITIYPDFTIRHPVTGQYYYWEHFGMMDEEDYRNHAFNKMNLYCKNGIIPFVNLIMIFEAQNQPLRIKRVESIIYDYFATESNGSYIR